MKRPSFIFSVYDPLGQCPRPPTRKTSLVVRTSEMILTKEQLYDMFQNILGIKKYEHQILYNAMQVRETELCSRVCRYANWRDSVRRRVLVVGCSLRGI